MSARASTPCAVSELTMNDCAQFIFRAVNLYPGPADKSPGEGTELYNTHGREHGSLVLSNSNFDVYPALGEEFVRSKLNENKMSNPVVRILVWALCVGGVSFAAGWFGPGLFSTGNLASLL